MKTVIVLCYLVTLVTAIPTSKGKFKKTDTGYDSNSVIFKRETKSSLNDPVTEELKHKENTHKAEPTLSFGSSVFEGRSLGFKKPLIIKKKFGYHLYRDSDEEKEYADPHENCSKQVKVKLCDEESCLNSNQLSRSLTSARLSEHMLDKDMENSIKMAKEAVENLQRDLKKMEHNSEKLRENSSGESLVSNMDVQHDIEVAREALEHVHKSFGNMESMDSQLRAPKTEETKLFTVTDEDKLDKWKNAIDNIHKNFEIARNIEDTFKTESLMLSSDDLTEERKSQQSDIVDDQVQQQSFDGTFENTHQKNANDEKDIHKDDNIEGKFSSDFGKSSTFEEDHNVEDSDMYTASSNKESTMELFSDSLRKEMNTPESRSTGMEKEALDNHELEIKSDEHLTKEKSSINLWDKEHDKIISHERTIDDVPESRDTVTTDTLMTNQEQNIGIDGKSNELSIHSMKSKNDLQNNQDMQKEVVQDLENNDKTNLAKEENTENNDKTNLAKEENTENNDKINLANEENTENNDKTNLVKEENAENNEQNDHDESVKFSQLIQDLLHKEENQKSSDSEKDTPEYKERSLIPEEKFITGEDGALLMRKTKLENDDLHDMHVSASDHHDVRTVSTSRQEKDARDVIDDHFSLDKTWEMQKSDLLQSINEQNDLNEFISMRSMPESQVEILSPELDNEQHTSNNILSARMPENQIMHEIATVNHEIQDGSLMRSAEVKDKDHMLHEWNKEQEILTHETEMSKPRTTDLTNSKDSQSMEQKSAKMSVDNDITIPTFETTTFMPKITYWTTSKDSQLIEEKSTTMNADHNIEGHTQKSTTFGPRITDVTNSIQQVVGTEITTDLPSLRLVKEEKKGDEETQQLKNALELHIESAPVFKDSIDVEKHMFNERANTKIMEEQNVVQQNRKNHELHDLAEQKELTEQVDQQFKSVSESNNAQILPQKELSSIQDVQNEFVNTRMAEERNTELMSSNKQETQNVLPATITEFHNRHALSSPVENNEFENGQSNYNVPTGMRLAEDLHKNHHLHAPLVNRWSQDNENYHFSPEYKSVSGIEHSLPMKTPGLTSSQHNILNEDTMSRMSKDRNTYGGQQFGDSHRVQDSLSVSWNQEEQNKYYQSQGYNNRPDLYGNNFRPHFNSQPYGYGYRSGNQFDLAGNHDFSQHSPRTMEHMHMKTHGKESELDNTMQPSTQLNMRDSGLHLDHHHHSMSRFGAGVPIAGVGSGAVGVFPHSNTGCGIPLMLSCSPSVVSGSIARSHPSAITPSFRSGDDSMYYMKRETKSLSEAAKIQKLPVPFNHKPEFILNKQ